MKKHKKEIMIESIQVPKTREELAKLAQRLIVVIDGINKHLDDMVERIKKNEK
jgi:hypothetical protein